MGSAICGGRYEKHEEIVFEGRTCPLCEAIDTIEKISKELEDCQKSMSECANARTGE